jgi:hypothetical protein
VFHSKTFFSCCVLVASAAFSLGAAPWTLTPIVESNSDTFATASIVNGTVVYHEFGSSGESIREWLNGVITTLMDRSTPIPGEAGTVATFNSSPAFDGTHVVVAASGASGKQALYEISDGVITRLVDTSTPVPGQPGLTFTNFTGVNVNGPTIAFSARNTANVSGVYSIDGSGVHLVAAPGSAGPDGSFNFTFTDGGKVSDGAVFFNGSGKDAMNHTVSGIYRYANDQITTVLDNTSPAPGGGTFQAVALGSIDGNDFAGNGAATSTSGLIVKIVNGVAYDVADFHHSAPGLNGNLQFAGTTSLAKGTVVFNAGDASIKAIFTDAGGSISEILAPGDILQGKTVQRVDMTANAFDGNQAVLQVQFTDNSSGLFMAILPEPGCASLIVATFSLLLRRKRVVRN